MLSLRLYIRPLGFQKLEERDGAFAVRHLGRLPRLRGLPQERLLEATDPFARHTIARNCRADLLGDLQAQLLCLVPRDERFGLGALDLALILIEDGQRQREIRADLIGEVSRDLKLTVRVPEAHRDIWPRLRARQSKR